MRKFLWLISFLSLLTAYWAVPTAQAQPYGNEWINYSKTYYKFKVGKDALYRIPFSTLQAAGLGSQSGVGYKVFHKGAEVPIYVTANGTLGSSDYIELFGERNDGSFDTQLYAQPDWQINPYQSMFSDTSFYYLVWDNIAAGQRFTNQNNNISSPPAPEAYFQHTVTTSYKNVANNGKPFRLGGSNHWFADFEDGEGLGSLNVNSGQSFPTVVETPAKYTGIGAGAGHLSLAVAGVSNDPAFLPDHAFTVRVNGTTYITEQFEGYEHDLYESDLFMTDIDNANTTVVFESTNGLGYTNMNTISYVSLTYPRTFDFANKKTFDFTLANSQQKYLEITNFNGGTAPILYDLTNRMRLVPVLESGVYKFLLPAGLNPSSPRHLYFSTTDTPCAIGCTIPACNPAQCSFYTVPSLVAKQFTNYGAAANQGDYIMITHSRLRAGATDWVAQYETYRQSAAGGAYNVVVADIDELYDQFSMGIPKHPLAIRRFVDFAIDNWGADPRFLLLLGKSIRYTNFAEFYYADNLVPTYGFTSSDNMLSVDGVDSYLPRIPTGRVSSLNPNQVRAYLEKMIEYETAPACTREARQWTKKVLQVSTAWSDSEHEEFSGYLDEFEQTVSGVQYAGDVTTFDHCENNCSPPSNPAAPFVNAFNAGASVVTLFGHSLGPLNWAFDGMNANPADYTNFGKYPFMITNSCFVGDIHQYSFSNPNNSMAERYILADNLGAIGYVATVNFGIPSYLSEFSSLYYEGFSNSQYGQPMGQIMSNVLTSLYNPNPEDPAYNGKKVTIEELTFAGDPALVLVGAYEHPEFIIQNNGSYTDVQIRDSETNALLSGTIPNSVDSIDVTVHVTNIGQVLNGNLQIRIQRQVGAGSPQTVIQQLVPNPIDENTYTFTIAVNAVSNAGSNTFTILVDSNGQYTEDCEDNNTVAITLNVESSNCAGLAPPVIAATATSFCANSSPITLSATPAGGTFSGSGVSGNTFNPSGLAPGTYTLTYTYVYPENDCSVFAVRNVTVNAQPSAEFVPTATTTCIGSPITLNVAPYDATATYTWSFGAGGSGSGSPQSQVVSWTTAGNKTVTLTVTKNGCTEVKNIPIVVQAPLGVPALNCSSTTLSSVTVGWAPVAGANGYNVYVNGSLAQSNLGGTNYTVGGLSQGESVSVSVVAIGTGACGNSAVSAPQSCTAQDCPNISVSIPALATNTDFCSNEANIALVSEPAGGSFFITYPNGTQQAITAIVPGALPPATYVISVDYINGSCAYSSSYNITVADLPEPNIAGETILCTGASQTLVVDDLFSAYQWSNGSTEATTTISAAGTYTVTVSSSNGCTGVDAITVTAVAAPTVELNPSSGVNQVCEGSVLSISATAGFQLYDWSSGTVVSPAVINVSNAGTYTVTVTDNAGCQWTESINITSATIAQPMVSLNGQTANTGICGGTNNLLDAGAGYTSYVWSTGATTQQITITQANDYCVTVTNAAGCVSLACFSVTNSSLNAPSLNATATEYCNAAITISVNGAYDSYQWSGGSTNPQLSVSAAGTYYVTVTDNGCQATESIVIALSSQATPTAAFSVSSPATLCGSGSVVVDNESLNADNYLWTLTNLTDGSTQTSTDFNPIFSVNNDGTYSLSLVADAICGTDTDTEQLSTAVTVAAAPTADISADQTQICAGDPVVLTATTNNPTFQWLENGVPLSANGSPLTVMPSRNTVYAITLANQLGCTATDTIAIAVDENCELPTAITPNGDGYNDTWNIPQANSEPNLTVSIYNRWGQLVWNTTAYNNTAGAFDGKNLEGVALPEGTYYYLIEGLDSGALSGPITIIQ